MMYQLKVYWEIRNSQLISVIFRHDTIEGRKKSGTRPYVFASMGVLGWGIGVYTWHQMVFLWLIWLEIPWEQHLFDLGIQSIEVYTSAVFLFLPIYF